MSRNIIFCYFFMCTGHQLQGGTGKRLAVLKDKIFAFLAEETRYFSFDSLDDFHTAQTMAERFNVKRNTISHYLNQLIDDNVVIKLNTRPVYFLHRAVFEEHFFPVHQSVFPSLIELKKHQYKQENTFAELIGANGSLVPVIEKLNTAICYPPHGLSVMLYGPTGSGKSMLAQLSWKRAVEKQILPPAAPFIAFNCAQYANNPELLSSHLFGYVKGAFTGADKTTEGLLQKANGGVLFLDEIHRLNAESQEKLFTFMDTGRFRRMGESEKENSAQVRLIFATTVSPQEYFLDTFIRRIPLNIAIPSLEERGEAEKIQFIYAFFLEEAKLLGRNIKLSSQVNSVLKHHVYPGNVGELKNTITCMSAGRFAKSQPGQTLSLHLDDLPESIALHAAKTKHAVSGDPVVFTPTTTLQQLSLPATPLSQFISDFWDNIFELFQQQSEGTLLSTVSREIDTLFDKIIFDPKTKNVHSAIYSNLSAIQDIVQQIEDKHAVQFNGNRLYGLAWYFFTKNRQGNEPTPAQKKMLKNLQHYLSQHLAEEQFIAGKLSAQFEQQFDLTIALEDEVFFTLYLKSMKMVTVSPRTKAVILAHGYATASSIANVVNRMLGDTIFASFDMPIDTAIKDIASNILQYINDNDMSNGLVILVDMGSLTDIYSEFNKSIHFPVAIINNVSTAMALHVGELLLDNASLENIVENVTSYQKNDSKIIYSEQAKRPVIITCCYTGMGTAQRVQSLLEDSIPKEAGVDVIAYDHQLLLSESSRQSLFQFYNIIAVVGTVNPEIPFIPYISLDDLISGRGDVRLDTVFQGIADAEMIQTINDRLVHNFSLKRVIAQLTILDTGKILEHLDICLCTLERLLKKRLANETKINLYVHVSCMLERLIRQIPIETYSSQDTFSQNDKETLCMIQDAFSVIEDTYSVTIPFSEIGYIYDIIKSN